MKREQIIEILQSYRIWFGDAMAIHEDAFNNLADDILALQRKDLIIESFERENNYVTDEDIEEWRKEQAFNPDRSNLTSIQESIVIAFNAGLTTGAKAFRDGEIKHIE